MKASKESLAAHREHLSREITRQRGELHEAYRGMAKPLLYTQTGIKGLQALQKNAWMVALTPTLVNLGFSFFGWKKKGRPDVFSAFGKRKVEREAAEKVVEQSFLRKWTARGWTLFKIYRKFRPFFP